MTKMKELLVNYEEFDNPQKVGMGDGSTVEAHGRGDIYFTLTLEKNMSKKVTMCNALYVRTKVNLQFILSKSNSYKGKYVQ